MSTSAPRPADLDQPRTAVITGGSAGFGLALVTALLDRGWTVITDARDRARLERAAAALPHRAHLTAIVGDVADGDHRDAVRRAAVDAGGLDLLVNNASVLGPSPQPRLAEYPLAAFVDVYRVNVFAPLALTQLLLPLVRPGGKVVNVSSDAAVEAYEGWGGYGSAKAALDHVTAVLAAENPGLRVYAFDPGDMRTEMQQQAFPGEDISDRPEPAAVVPALLRLLDGDRPSGRVRADDLGVGS